MCRKPGILRASIAGMISLWTICWYASAFSGDVHPRQSLRSSSFLIGSPGRHALIDRVGRGIAAVGDPAIVKDRAIAETRCDAVRLPSAIECKDLPRVALICREIDVRNGVAGTDHAPEKRRRGESRIIAFDTAGVDKLVEGLNSGRASSPWR